MPISFHIGGGDIGALMLDPAGMGFQANFAKVSSLIMVDNMRCVADLIFAGICHRFPRLKFVSVESGVGWIPGVLETFDWQWKGGGIGTSTPSTTSCPRSTSAARSTVASGSSGPAPSTPSSSTRTTSSTRRTTRTPPASIPVPGRPGQLPRDFIAGALRSLPESTLRKVLFDNAAALYGVLLEILLPRQRATNSTAKIVADTSPVASLRPWRRNRPGHQGR